MAYVNVKDWSVDQVTDWLKGLDNVILQYNTAFLNNGVTGHQLLNLRADDLEHLGVRTLGHQEIVLEAVEHLRNFHYELDKENLQTLALRLSCVANSLFKELLLIDEDCPVVQTQVMSDVHNIITTIKPLVFWLERSPFAGDKDYIDTKTNLLQLGFEMATSAHRGIFSEKPVRTIRKICEKLAKIADHIIQEMMDPMILQPASLDLATLKKKEQELGFFILPNNHAIHQIADIKHGSPAHGSSKIEEGDEIVQVNYQTVVGWQRKKVMMLLQESPPEIVLTLKKRPRHTKVYGQIYMKPYRLPSRKRSGQTWSTRWNDSIPSPRLLPIFDLPPITITRIDDVVDIPDVETELSSSDSEPPDSPSDGSIRMYPNKPRPILQRRNTITGATPTSKRPYPSLEQYWEFIKSRANPHSSSYNINSTKFEEDAKFLRDKSTSCNVGLDLSPRPTTVIGLSHSNSASGKKTSKDKSNQKRVNFEEECESLKQKKEEKTPTVSFLEPSNLDENKSVSINSLASLNNENITFIDEGRELTDRTSMALDWKKEIVEEIIDAIKMKPIEEQNENKISNTSVNRRNSVKSNLEDIKCDLGDNKTNSNSVDIKSDSGGNKSNSPKSTPGDIRSEAGVNRSNSVKSNLGELDNRSNLILKKDPILSEINVHSIIKIFDEQKPKPHVLPRSVLKKPPEVPQKPEGKIRPAVPPRSATTKLKGRLDKSHSTPAYDLTEEVGENVPETPLSVEETSDEFAMPNLETLSLTPQETIIVEESLVKSTIKIEEAGVEGSFKLEASISEVAVKEEVSIVEDKTVDVPPKPPPRNIVSAPKPLYPADSPKPVSFIESTQANRSEATPTRSIFEFPEFKQTEPSNSCDSLDDGLPPKYFDPKLISTPVTKSKLNVETDAMMHKPGPSYEMPKMTTSEKKVSPTNSIVKAMISGKGKSGKKKNTLANKRRKVSVSELTPATIQGYLYQRLRSKHNQNVHWEKRWFVLLGHCLYGFKTKEDSKAACLIFLSGFTVAVANEVKSRSNAFKVYHTGTVFYFSADDPDALQSWIDLIRTATLHNETSKYQDTGLYSETDESDTERTKLSDEKSDSLKKFGSLKKFSSKKSQNDPPHSGSTSLDRKWFFNKSSNQPKHSLPVPTPQFRSYRKIRAAELLESSVTTGNFTSHVPMFAPQSLTYSQNVSVPNLMVEITKHEQIAQQKQKTKPINYVHASNPSLYSVNDFSIPPTFKKNQFKPCNENLAGFVTLEELMIKQTEERKLNPHHIVEAVAVNLQSIQPDVVYGEVPIRPKNPDIPPDLPPDNGTKAKRNSSSSSSEKHDSTSSCFGKRLGSLKKNKSNDFENKTATYPKTTKVCEQKVNRSLPRAHKLQEVPMKHEACTSLYCSDRTLSTDQKKRSYEMIYCPETVNDVQFALNRALDGTMCHDTPKKNSKLKKQHSFSSADKKSKFSEKAQDSFSSKVRLKSATQYTPMSLPLSQDSNSKPKFAFELNLDEKSHKGGKLKQMFGGKSEGKKEKKTFLGSPKLHRAIFKKHNSGSDLSWSSSTSPQTSMSQSTYSLEDSPPVISEPCSNISPHTDYPGMEYPPVFEPETYSLADPQSSLSLLRKQGKNTP